MSCMSKRNLTNAPLLDAAAGKTPSRPAVWFMRQAGRSLPEYRTAREGISMLDSCFMPELLAEITRSEEHTSELQSRGHLVCRLLLEKKKTQDNTSTIYRS